MSSRYLALTSVERFMAAERYRQSHQPTLSTRPDQDHRPEAPASRDSRQPAGKMAAGIDDTRRSWRDPGASTRSVP
jgi:hypothetical protein